MRLGNITFGGHVGIVVGGTRYGIPRGARAVHSDLNGARIAYVLDGRQLHVLVAGGEILDVPDPLARLITNKIFGTS